MRFSVGIWNELQSCTQRRQMEPSRANGQRTGRSEFNFSWCLWISFPNIYSDSNLIRYNPVISTTSFSDMMWGDSQKWNKTSRHTKEHQCKSRLKLKPLKTWVFLHIMKYSFLLKQQWVNIWKKRKHAQLLFIKVYHNCEGVDSINWIFRAFHVGDESCHGLGAVLSHNNL